VTEETGTLTLCEGTVNGDEEKDGRFNKGLSRQRRKKGKNQEKEEKFFRGVNGSGRT